MWRKLLILTLCLSSFFEFAFAFAIFFAPEFTLAQFGVGVSDDALFLAFGIGLTIVFVALICGLAFKQVLERNLNGLLLADVLGYWWIIVGIAIYLKAGNIDNLFIDSLKGFLIVFFNYNYKHSINSASS